MGDRLAGSEGTRVRGFLKQLCGGTGLKQFSPIIGRRSMLQHTLHGRASEGGSIAPAHPLATREHYLPNRYCARYPAAVFIHYPPATRRPPLSSPLPIHFVRDENRFMDAVAGVLAALKRHSGKSDWGTVASILRSLIEIGQLETFRMRLEESQVHPSWYAASLAEIDPQSKDLAPEAVYSSIRTEVEAYLSPD